MQELKVWNLISRCLQGNQPVLLLLVTSSEGSSPGRQGFKMAVAKDGEMAGSVGGGIMEQKFVTMALEMLENDENTILHRQQFHTKEAAKDQSGMICSGEQSLALIPLRSDDILPVNSIIQCITSNGDGQLFADANGLRFAPGEIMQGDYSFSQSSESDWTYIEKVGLKHHVSIIGAGHVGLALSKLLTDLDFYIRIFDDRPGLNTMIDNKWAHEKIIGDYGKIGEKIPEGENEYVVIMTFGYRPDGVVIRQLLDKKFRYLGMMGSKAKVQEMYAELESEGFTRQHLSKLYSPIGVDIGSRSPAEIAVAVAAELIRVRNSK